MKTTKYIANFLFERLHRYVFDNYFIQGKAVTRKAKLAHWAYEALDPFFKGWRMYLKTNQPHYDRYNLV